MFAASITEDGGYRGGVYLLYVTGDGVDYAKLQEQLKEVPHFGLGPFCWLVLLSEQAARPFSDAASFALPMEGGKAELLLCRVSQTGIVHGNAGGLGLVEWLKKNGYFPGLQGLHS